LKNLTRCIAMNEPLFSIVIPTYNRATLLLSAVDSVLAQKFDNYEVIIVDDGSSDNTELLCKEKYGEVENVKYIRQVNSERGAARNNGLKASEGKYISYFDSDDLICKNHLSEASAFIQQKAFPEVFHLNYTIEDEEGNTIGKGPELKGSPANKELIKGNFLSCNGVFVRRDIALGNQFNEDRELAGMEDWELWLRIASKYSIHYIDTPTSVISNHSSRSVVSGSIQSLIKRVSKLLYYILENEEVVKYFKSDINKFVSSCFTYISLHIALTYKNRYLSIKYLLKGFYKNPRIVFERRFFAIIKHLLVFNSRHS